MKIENPKIGSSLSAMDAGFTEDARGSALNGNDGKTVAIPPKEPGIEIPDPSGVKSRG